MRYLRMLLSTCVLATGAAEASGQPRPVLEAAVSVPGTAVERVAGTLHVPDAARINSVVVFIARGPSTQAFEDPAWRASCDTLGCAMLHLEITSAGGQAGSSPQQAIRDAAAGGARGLLTILDTLAVRSGLDELRHVPLVIWGFSAAGNFPVTFAALHPERTAAIVRYHSNMRDTPVQIGLVRGIPALIIAGERDAVAGVEDSERFWLAGRGDGAPWTYVLQPGAEHFPAPEGFRASSELQISWIAGVLGQRVTSEGTLREISDPDGLSGDHVTARIFETADGTLSPRTSWLPDTRTAREWRCRALPFVVR